MLLREAKINDLGDGGPSVLVLGGTGFIGSHIVERLIKDYQVRVYSRGHGHFANRVPGVDYRVGDFITGVGLYDALENVHTVVHCVSTTIPKSSNAIIEHDIQSNLVSTIRLLQLCVERKVKRVIFISSGGTVYGQPQILPIPESHPTSPLVSHGIVKLAIEKYLAVYERIYGLEYVILRGANVYGARQDPSGQQGFINVVLGRVVQGLPITVFGDGKTVKDYLYVKDFAAACALAVNAPGSCQGVYNIGSGVGVSNDGIIREATSITGISAKVEYRERMRDDVEFILDIKKSAANLNWTPRWSLREGMVETWLWTKVICGI
jgi:UDP-glucose 4-epimerase